MSFGSAPVPGGGVALTPQSALLRQVSPPGGAASFPLSGLRLLVGRSLPMSRVDLDLTPLETETPFKISRLHAEFTWADGTLQIRDLGSSNGTWVNGERLQGREPGRPSDPRTIQAGDRIRLAHLEFEVTTASPGD